MAKTLDNLMDEVRLLLKDRREPYRYSTADLLDGVNTAFITVKTLRPDAFLVCCTDENGDTALPTYTEADLGLNPATDFPIDQMFYLPVVYHVVGKIQLGDDEFAVDNRAMSLLAAARQGLLGA